MGRVRHYPMMTYDAISRLTACMQVACVMDAKCPDGDLQLCADHCSLDRLSLCVARWNPRCAHCTRRDGRWRSLYAFAHPSLEHLTCSLIVRYKVNLEVGGPCTEVVHHKLDLSVEEAQGNAPTTSQPPQEQPTVHEGEVAEEAE